VRNGGGTPLSGADPSLGERPRRAAALVAADRGEVDEPAQRLACRIEVRAREPDLHKQLEQRHAAGIRRVLALETQVHEVLRQRHIASRQRDRRPRSPGPRMPLVALEQTLGHLELALPHAQLCEPHQREDALRAVAALEHADRGEQLLLRFGPAPDRGEDRAVVRSTGGRDEVLPGDELTHHRHPLLGAAGVGGVLAGAQQPAVDLADGTVAHDLARGYGGHRPVEQRHPLSHAPGGDVDVAEQGERVELEVGVTEPPGDRERRGASRSRSDASSVHGARSSVSQPWAALSSAPSSTLSACAIQPFAAARLPWTEICRKASQRATSAASRALSKQDCAPSQSVAASAWRPRRIRSARACAPMPR
jgi:hypothetical protein